MALTPDEIRAWILSRIDTSAEPNWSDQNDVSLSKGLHVKHDHQLLALKALYKNKVPRIVQVYQESLEEVSRFIKNFDIPAAELKEELEGTENKVRRLAEKWLAVKREIEGRTKGYFERSPIGTTYYIDLINGNDASPHDGLKVGNYTADAGTNTTTLIETSELGRTSDDDWNGAYLYNVTRGIGVLITDSAYVAGTWTLTHPTITGQTSGDTYFIIDAWKTIEQYTTVTARSAGDIAYVRANTTQTGTQAINFDEDGNQDSYIKIIGCDATTNDPWGDSSDVLPIYDCNAGNFGWTPSSEDYWYIERMGVKNSSAINIYISYSYAWYFKDCQCIDSADRGLAVGGGANPIFNGCTFSNNTSANIREDGGAGNTRYVNCIIDAGVGGTTYGLYLRYAAARVDLIDCSIGQTNAHTIGIYLEAGGNLLYMRNTSYDSITIINTQNQGNCILSEDDDATYLAGLITTHAGTVARETGVKTGSAVFSLKMLPNAECGANSPLIAGYHSPIEAPFVVQGTASQQITCTIKIRSLGTWGTYPTNTELYIEASYYDSGADAGRTLIKSTQVLSHASDWVDFTVTMTPLRDGPIYINAYLKKFEDLGDGCYVNGEAVTS